MAELTAGFPGTAEIAKAQARRLRSALAPRLALGHSQALELIARTHGEVNWGRMCAVLEDIAAKDAGSVPAPVAQPLPGQAEGIRPQIFTGDPMDQRALQALWKGIRDARPTSVTPRAIELAARHIREGLVPVIGFESWLDRLDTSMGGMVFDMGTENLLKLIRIEPVTLFRRPRARDTETSGQQVFKLAAFASGLIFLERLGFNSHPEVYVEAILPALKATSHLDAQEVDCFWHAKERQKFRVRLDLFDPTVSVKDLVHEEKLMDNGTRIRIARTRDELPLIRYLGADR